MQDGAGEIIGSYVKWHYGRAIKEFSNLSRNVNRFLFHFFSIKLLVRTWFSPWRRLHEDYEGGLNVGSFFSSLVVNSLMRLVGFIFRTLIISIGLFVLALYTMLSVAMFVLWLFFPLSLAALVASAIILILSAL